MTPIPAQVRQELSERRAAGETFSDAWAAVVATVRGREADAWKAALRSTAEAWARAYAGEPLTRREQALSLVATDLEPLSARRCAHCHRAIPEATGRGQHRRRFCSDRCRRAYHTARGN
jgi:hypothetical protein